MLQAIAVNVQLHAAFRAAAQSHRHLPQRIDFELQLSRVECPLQGNDGGACIALKGVHPVALAVFHALALAAEFYAVIAQAAYQGVLAFSAVQRVVASAAAERIVTAPTIHPVADVGAHEGVALLRAIQIKTPCQQLAAAQGAAVGKLEAANRDAVVHIVLVKIVNVHRVAIAHVEQQRAQAQGNVAGAYSGAKAKNVVV